MRMPSQFLLGIEEGWHVVHQALQWRHNERDGATNPRRLDCLLNRFGHINQNIEAPHHWPLWGNLPVTCEFPAQRASNAENVSIWRRHHVVIIIKICYILLLTFTGYVLLSNVCLSMFHEIKRTPPRFDDMGVWQLFVFAWSFEITIPYHRRMVVFS